MSSKEQDESQIVNGFGAVNYIGWTPDNQIVNGFGAVNYIGWTPDNWLLEKSQRSRCEGGCVVVQSYHVLIPDKEVIIFPCLGYCVGAWKITEIEEITNTKEYIVIRLRFEQNKEAK